MTDHHLTLGQLVLTGSRSFADPTHGFWFEVAAEGTEFGNPEAVTSIVESLMSDGRIVSYDKDDNRTVPVRVRVFGPTLAAVAHGEAALRRETRRRNELTWQPPDDFAPASVYVTYPSPMRVLAESGWDLDEKMRRVRTVALTLSCDPYAMSADYITVPALEPGTGTETVIDTCDSATGWTAGANGQSIGAADPAWLGQTGAVWAHTTSNSKTLSLTRSASIAMTNTPYLRVNVRSAVLARVTATAVIGGATRTLNLVSQQKSTQAVDEYEFVYTVPAGTTSLSSLTITRFGTLTNTAFGVSEVARTGRPPGATKRQVSRIIEPGGTERTPAKLHVYSEYDLSDMQIGVIHTCPNDGSGYSPPLRRWRVTGNTPAPAEGDTLSMFSEPLKPASSTCEVPNGALPEGGYVLAARMKASTTNTVSIDWAAHTFFTRDWFGYQEEGIIANSKSWTPAAVGEWELVELALLTLPTVRGVDGTTRISFRCLATNSDVFWDEAFLFRVDEDCALTILHHPPDHIWLDSPDADSPESRVSVGYSADGSDARHPGDGLLADGTHVLHPDGTIIYTGGITNDIRAEAKFRRGWHTNAAS